MTIKSIALSDILPKNSSFSADNVNTFMEHLENHGLVYGDKKENEETKQPKKISVVCPYLPHSCELEILNSCALLLANEFTIYTSVSQKKTFDQFCASLNVLSTPILLNCVFLETTHENKTFLSGLESELEGSALIITFGENSLASYQASKVKRSQLGRLIIWQNSPRPPHANVGARTLTGAPIPAVARERTVRKEVLKSCDIVLCFDKDGATWSYLEDVSASHIRRVTRSINQKRFSEEISTLRRIELRSALKLPETDFIFLHLGPLEIESGALDSVYAFKNLLQSNTNFLGHARLCFCGSGTAAADIRQTVVEMDLDDHVYFLNPEDDGFKEMFGNQFSSILSICDAVIHAPISPVNGNPLKFLDSTYDILCALSYGIMIISNGHGWIGEWIGRFYKTFSSGSIHSLGRLMQESIEKQDKIHNVKNAVRKAINNEFPLEKVCEEIVALMNGLLNNTRIEPSSENITRLIEQVESLVRAKEYIEAINLMAAVFQKPELTNVQKATLFRLVGDSFTKLGDLNNGVDNYTRSIELDPFCAKSFIGLGTVSLQRGDFNIAIPQFQKAVTLAANDDMANLGLGLSFEGLNELKESYKWTHRACVLNPENTVAIYHIVKLSYQMEEFKTTLGVLEKYISIHPNDVNMIYTLGGMYFKVGNFMACQALMENILRLDPLNSRALSLLNLITRNDPSKKQA